MNLKTKKEIDDHIESHKVSLKTFEKTFGYKKKTITLPTFMWDRILDELWSIKRPSGMGHRTYDGY